jgi:hypothetical protein
VRKSEPRPCTYANGSPRKIQFTYDHASAKKIVGTEMVNATLIACARDRRHSGSAAAGTIAKSSTTLRKSRKNVRPSSVLPTNRSSEKSSRRKRVMKWTAAARSSARSSVPKSSTAKYRITGETRT